MKINAKKTREIHDIIRVLEFLEKSTTYDKNRIQVKVKVNKSWEILREFCVNKTQ